jgi:hypothetical protein
MLLRETGLCSAFLLAKRLSQQISGGAIEARGKKIVSVTASQGYRMKEQIADWNGKAGSAGSRCGRARQICLNRFGVEKL